MTKSLLIDHAAAELGVSRRTVYHRIAAGRLSTIVVGTSTRVLLNHQFDRERYLTKVRRKDLDRCMPTTLPTPSNSTSPAAPAASSSPAVHSQDGLPALPSTS